MMSKLNKLKEIIEFYAHGSISTKKWQERQDDMDELGGGSRAAEGLKELRQIVDQLNSESLFKELAILTARNDLCGFKVEGKHVLCNDPCIGDEKDGYGKKLRQDVCQCEELAKAAINMIKEKSNE